MRVRSKCQQNAVEGWLRQQSKGTPLLASWAVAALKDEVDPVGVARVFGSLVGKGVIRSGFAVRLPTGSLQPHFYEKIEEIPIECRDALNRPVDRDDVEVLPAFERVDD